MSDILTYLAPILAVALGLSGYFLLIQYRETQVARQINAIKKALSFALVSGHEYIDLGTIPPSVLKSDRLQELIEYIVNYPNLPEGFIVLDDEYSAIKQKLKTNQPLTHHSDGIFSGVKRATKYAVKSFFKDKTMDTPVKDGRLTIVNSSEVFAVGHILTVHTKAVVPVVTVSLSMVGLEDVQDAQWSPILKDRRISFKEGVMTVRYVEIARLQISEPEVVSKFHVPAISKKALNLVDVFVGPAGSGDVAVSHYRVETPIAGKSNSIKREMCIAIERGDDIILILDDLAYCYDFEDFADVRQSPLVALVRENMMKQYDATKIDRRDLECTLRLGHQQISVFHSGLF